MTEMKPAANATAAVPSDMSHLAVRVTLERTSQRAAPVAQQICKANSMRSYMQVFVCVEKSFLDYGAPEGKIVQANNRPAARVSSEPLEESAFPRWRFH